jgi:osmotically-inducible protein OsmY
MKHSTLLAPRPDPAGLLPSVGTPGEKLKLAIGRAARRARRIARTVTTRVAAARREARHASYRPGVNRVVPRPRAAEHGGTALSISGRAPGGGGMSIEMWRADDGGRAVLQSRLQRGVFDEFALEPALDPADIRVVVDGRVVTLLGTVKSYLDKLAAERAAKRVRGVQMVRDELAVMPPASQQRTDWEITLAAMQVLESHVLVPRDQVQATVAGGWVRLAGEVGRGAERRAAGQAVQCLVGVKGVSNLITIKVAAPPAGLRARVTAALTTAGLHRHRIDVAIEDGDVVLQGRVPCVAERERVEQAAWDVPAVTSVRNQLRVSR